MTDRLAERLRATFLGELGEQVRAMNADLLALEAEPEAPEPLKSLFRAAHTVKGAAHAADIPLVGTVCHALETLLADVRDGRAALGREQFALLFSAVDALDDAGRRLAAGGDLAGSPLAAMVRALEKDGPPPAPPVAFAPTSAGGSAVAPAPATGADVRPASDGRVADGALRVGAEKLDALVASTGQLLASAGAIAGHAPDLNALGEAVSSWAGEWRRISRRLRLALERSGAPASLAHSLTDAEDQLQRVVRETSRVAAALTRDSRRITRAASDVADGVRMLRMRPFAEACEALPRAVRDLSVANGKETRLELAGTDVQVDRAVLDGLREAILQLVRNAVDHGIEPPAVREQRGKLRSGVIKVGAVVRGDRIVVVVSDDGGGLDLEAIRTRLAGLGQAVPTTEYELARTLFHDGFTTRSEATVVSGRGVGLDLVRVSVERLGGSVDVTWAPGKGTAFTIEAPLTLATIHAVLVAHGAHVFAIPSAAVERLVRLKPEDIKHANGRAVVITADAPVPLVTLAPLLGAPFVDRPLTGPTPVVMLAAAGRRVAIAVEELLTDQDLVVRPVRSARAPLVTGAAILGTGRPAVVLHPAAIVAAGVEHGGAPAVNTAASTGGERGRRRILVVDDSITTRTLEQSILEAAGYDVHTAVDGADGWRLLQEQGADLVISDVEMPRMDGFALCAAVRSSKRFTGLPVILVTALETPEHRERGLEVGADAYIGKSSFDQQRLLETIRQLIGAGAQ